MKIAILLSGEYRSFNICRPTMTFLNDLDVDVYVSTWDITHHVRPGINLSEYEKVTEDQITQLLGRPAMIKIESATIQHTLPNHYNCSMIHRWKYGFDLIQNSGIKYDYVMITRFDLCFDPVYPIDIKKNLHLFIESLGSSWTREGKLGDVFMLSSYHKMEEFMNSITIEKWIAGPEPDWHTWFYNFASTVFSEIINYTDIHYTICRYLSNQGDTFDKILEHHYDWRDIQIVEFLLQNPDSLAEVWSPKIKKNALDKWHSGVFNKYKQNVITEMRGFSGSIVHLMQEPESKKMFVRKQGNIIRNYEKLTLLGSYKFNVPKIYHKSNDVLDIEYIPGIDIKSFLLRHNVGALVNFINDTIDKLSSTSFSVKDYSEIYKTQLASMDYQYLPFTEHSLYEKLPKILPQSLCHGDLTLENLIYSKDNQFYMIDPSTGPYDSWIFDIAKMRQDFDGHWFIRNSNIDLSVHLKTLRDQLYVKFPEAFDDSLYILMLLRVYRHCKVDSFEHKFIIQEIKKIWN